MGRKEGNPGNRGNRGMTTGMLRIRAYMTQRGRPAANITIPIEIMQAFGWMPGQYLLYYPTEAKELVLVNQGQAIKHLSPDYDLSMSPKGEPLPPPRAGSISEREINLTRHYEDMATRIHQAGPDDDDDKDNPDIGATAAEIFEVAGLSREERRTRLAELRVEDAAKEKAEARSQSRPRSPRGRQKR